MQIYSIKNEKLGFFNRPIYVESSAEALSYIQNVLMNDADRALRGLRGDLALYFLGDIDFTTGSILAVPEVYKICDLADLFDSIPEEKLRDKYKDLFESFEKKVADLSEELRKEKDFSDSLYEELNDFRHAAEDRYMLKKGVKK